MNPIEIRIIRHTKLSPHEMCIALLDTERWHEFEGYSILPGIKAAHFETKTVNWVGSRIKVQNTDGTAHVEEIITWDEEKRVALKFQEFTPPLSHLATHFIETWEFHTSAAGTEVSRAMVLYPKNILGWLLLLPIAHLMKKAFEKNATLLSKQ